MCCVEDVSPRLVELDDIQLAEFGLRDQYAKLVSRHCYFLTKIIGDDDLLRGVSRAVKKNFWTIRILMLTQFNNRHLHSEFLLQMASSTPALAFATRTWNCAEDIDISCPKSSVICTCFIGSSSG